MRLAVFLVALVGLGCGSKGAGDGLPPATDWSDNDPALGTAPAQEPGPQRPNPHEGVPGAPDLAEDDPHKDVPGAPPLAGMQAQQADEEVVEESPAHINVTPDQPNDPATRVRGQLKIAKALAGKIKPDGIIYLMAKLPDAQGKPTGTAMAVERTMWKADGQAFELGGATGEVLVIARYDQDGEGTSAQPGDIVGMTRVKVPADHVVIELSTVVQ